MLGRKGCWPSWLNSGDPPQDWTDKLLKTAQSTEFLDIIFLRYIRKYVEYLRRISRHNRKVLNNNTRYLTSTRRENRLHHDYTQTLNKIIFDLNLKQPKHSNMDHETLHSWGSNCARKKCSQQDDRFIFPSARRTVHLKIFLPWYITTNNNNNTSKAHEGQKQVFSLISIVVPKEHHYIFAAKPRNVKFQLGFQ